MKKLFVSIIVVMFAVIAVLWYWGIIIFNYPSKDKYSVIGVDVSSYQGDIDWEILASEGIDFAFIKATEGSTFVDKKFSQNYENAIKTHLKIGAYHFFSYESDGSTQADNFINNVPKNDSMFPPVVDIEFYGDKYKNIPDKNETRKQLGVLLDRLEEYYGKKPIIYATYKSYNLYIADNFYDNPIWIRNVYTIPKLKDNREWTFWQFSDKKRLNGYKGKEKRIDFNVFVGSKEELMQL